MVCIEAVNAAAQDGTLLKRFAAKIFIDVLPAAFTSLIGSVLIAQYQGHIIAAPQPAAAQVEAASPEMMRLVRDEHAAIMDYLDAQLAAQKRRNQVADAALEAAKDRGIAEADTPQPAAAESVPSSPQLTAAKLVRHIKVAQAAVPPSAPLVVAQVQREPVATAVASATPPSRSLLDRTIDLKDHVVAATGNAARSVVSAIGGLPSFFAGIGDRKDNAANLTAS